MQSHCPRSQGKYIYCCCCWDFLGAAFCLYIYCCCCWHFWERHFVYTSIVSVAGIFGSGILPIHLLLLVAVAGIFGSGILPIHLLLLVAVAGIFGSGILSIHLLLLLLAFLSAAFCLYELGFKMRF